MKHGLFPKLISIFLIVVFLLLGAVPQTQADKVTFYHNDHLGSPLAMTDMQGSVVWRRDYKPFGGEIDPGGETATNTHKYTGKEYDPETGLYYYGARYYDPVIGRFISVDPAGGKSEIPQTWNRYIYTLNNPYKYVDPDGEFLLSASIAAGLAVACFSDYANAPENANTPTYEAQSSAEFGSKVAAAEAGGLAINKGLAYGLGKAFGKASESGSEIVQRAMSRREFEYLREQGLLRFGRKDTTFVSDAVNSSAKRARQRLALPREPEMRVTLKVEKGLFSPSKNVKSLDLGNGQVLPGGGLERSATGQIPAKIIRYQHFKR